MKKYSFFFSILVGVFSLVLATRVQATSITLKSLNYWDLYAAVGSGLDIGDCTFGECDETEDRYLPPNPPAGRAIGVGLDDLKVADSTVGYARARYEITPSSIMLSTEGEASTLGSGVEWYEAQSLVNVRSDTFSGAAALWMYLGWEVYQEGDLPHNLAFPRATISLVDFTSSTLIDTFTLDYEHHPSGNYVWYVDTLDPTHTYFLDLESYVYLDGEDHNLYFQSGRFSSSLSILDAVPLSEPIPEPSTVFLLGAGLIGIGFYRRKKG